MMIINYTPIGYLNAPIKSPQNAPIQPSGADASDAQIVINPELVAGLQDLADFSHLIVIYHFHLAKAAKLICRPFLDDQAHGIFAIRGPNRPNPIGLSIVELKDVEANVITIGRNDMVDGTPVLDIKPYVVDFDCYPTAAKGWLEGKAQYSKSKRSDDRFLL